MIYTGVFDFGEDSFDDVACVSCWNYPFPGRSLSRNFVRRSGFVGVSLLGNSWLLVVGKKANFAFIKNLNSLTYRGYKYFYFIYKFEGKKSKMALGIQQSTIHLN